MFILVKIICFKIRIDHLRKENISSYWNDRWRPAHHLSLIPTLGGRLEEIIKGSCQGSESTKLPSRMKALPVARGILVSSLE